MDAYIKNVCLHFMAKDVTDKKYQNASGSVLDAQETSNDLPALPLSRKHP
jgi:hypothetical protein